jgi:carbonic anhydrase
MEADDAIDPARVLGLEEGDAHVIRNAGGRTVEAIRSLVISQQLLGTREIVIVHHVCPLFPFPLSSPAPLSPPESKSSRCCGTALTNPPQTDCGMLTFTDNSIRQKIHDELHEKAEHVAFLPFSDVRQSVLDDIKVVKENKLLLDVPVTGYIYDVKTGKVERV